MNKMLRKIFKYIYNKRIKDEFNVVYYIFGIKIKRFRAKKAINYLYNHVNDNINNIYNGINFNNTELALSIWKTYGAYKDLLKYYDFMSHSQFVWYTYSKHFWLIYLSCLIETEELDKAELILNKYLMYKKDLEDFDRFLLVSKFANEKGITNDKIKKAVLVYNKLEENRKNDIFKKIIENKSIAVVGNAPTEIGKNKGLEIDSHDIVIRFNNYKTIGYENDYGTKTDIWARGSGTNDVIDRKNNFKLITWEADYNHWIVLYNHIDILYKQIEDKQLIYNFDYDCHSTLKQISGIDFPTSGLVLIWEIYRKLGNFNNVDFYGFNFCQEKPDKYITHYFNDQTKEDIEFCSNIHFIDKEADFLIKLVNGKI